MKKKMWKKVMAAALGMTLALGLMACGSKPAEEPAQSGDPGQEAEAPDTQEGETPEAGEPSGEKEILKVGMSGDYPPFEFYAETENGRELVGVDVELAKYIADSLGMELELTDMSFDGLIGSLDAGKFDLVISGMSIKEGRKCLFSNPYYTAEQSLLVKAGNEEKYASLDDLKGQKIGGQTGSFQEELANQYAGTDTAQIVPNVQDMVMMVAEGKLDGMFCEDGVALSVVARNDQLGIAKLDIPTEKNDLGVCIQEGNTEMQEKVNAIIDEVVEKNLIGEWTAQFLDVEEAAGDDAGTEGEETAE